MRRAPLLICSLVAALWAATPALALDRAELTAKLTREMRLAGPSSGALVRDVTTGETLFSVREDRVRVPASVQKLYTTAALLLRDGVDGRIVTSARSAASVDPGGVLRGDLFLVGQGDPTLRRDDLRRLAAAVADAGIARIDGAVRGDDSAFDQRAGAPSSGYRYDRWVGGLLRGLVLSRGWVGGRLQRDPGEDTAAEFAQELRRAGVSTAEPSATGVAPPEAREVARVSSPTAGELARSTNVPSDNYLAEMLLKGLGARHGGRGTTGAGAAVARAALDDFGVRPRIVDGSGLSRANRTTPRQVVRLLERMASQTSGPTFRASLPRAGREGTLKRRMRGTVATRRCQAKTGSLVGVSALAGYCTTAGGHEVAFAFLMSRVALWGARGVQDRMTVALARYEG